MEHPLGLFFLPSQAILIASVRSPTSDILTLWICHRSSNYGQVWELFLPVVHVFLSAS